jgi:hypothetical protein
MPAARVGEERGCALALPYIGGWAASLAPPPSLRAGGQGVEWGGKFSPFPLEHSLRVSPWAGRVGLRGLVRLDQVASTLPFRPTQVSIKWAHNGPLQNLLEPSGTIPINSETFPESKKLLSFR